MKRRSTTRLLRLRFAPLPVRLWPGKLREPDIVFMRAEHQDRIGEPYWGVPDLVMEVIWPGTRRVDAVIKVKEYAEAGIPGYWLVDPEGETITVLALSGSAYTERITSKMGDRARSVALPGFEVLVDEALAAR